MAIMQPEIKLDIDRLGCDGCPACHRPKMMDWLPCCSYPGLIHIDGQTGACITKTTLRSE